MISVRGLLAVAVVALAVPAAAAAQAPTYSYGPSNWVGEFGVQDEAYCAAAGNTWPSGTSRPAGAAIPQGTFLDLVAGQPSWDSHFTGATPAAYVVGVGLTCNNPPAGDVLLGRSTDAMLLPEGLYPVYGPRATTG
jgi:hypothetical protein